MYCRWHNHVQINLSSWLWVGATLAVISEGTPLSTWCLRCPIWLSFEFYSNLHQVYYQIENLCFRKTVVMCKCLSVCLLLKWMPSNHWPTPGLLAACNYNLTSVQFFPCFCEYIKKTPPLTKIQPYRNAKPCSLVLSLTVWDVIYFLSCYNATAKCGRCILITQ